MIQGPIATELQSLESTSSVLGPSVRKVTVLLGEEDRRVIAHIRETLEEFGLLERIFVARDGEDVISYIVGEGKYANREKYPRPDLVLLNTKLAKLSGLGVLCWLRSQPRWERLPVVLLRGGSSIGHVETVARLNASCIDKPTDRIALFRAINRSLRRVVNPFDRESSAEEFEAPEPRQNRKARLLAK